MSSKPAACYGQHVAPDAVRSDPPVPRALPVWHSSASRFWLAGRHSPELIPSNSRFKLSALRSTARSRLLVPITSPPTVPVVNVEDPVLG